jgi:hypothetical protein
MAALEVSRVFYNHIIYFDQTHPIAISIAADGRLNYMTTGYSLLPGQWDNRLIKTRTKVKVILKVGSYAKAYLSGFVEEALNETMEKTPVN